MNKSSVSHKKTQEAKAPVSSIDRKVNSSLSSSSPSSSGRVPTFSKRNLEASTTLLGLTKVHVKLMTLVDTPEVKVQESKTGPTSLHWDSRSAPRYLEYLASPQSMPVRASIRSMFGNRVYPFRLSTALNMSSSAAGIVNSTINASVVQSSTDFSAISSIFEEFFILRYDAHWMPVSRYQYPLGGTSTLSVANLPIGCAQLHHSAVPYSSASALLNNFGSGWHSTGDPFTYSWVNVESPAAKTEQISVTSQGWVSTTNGTLYAGALQFMSQSSPPALPFSQVLGTFATHFYCLFRVRE